MYNEGLVCPRAVACSTESDTFFCLTDVHVSDGPELELKSGITSNENW